MLVGGVITLNLSWMLYYNNQNNRLFMANEDSLSTKKKGGISFLSKK
jgi:hypothetical protein